MASKISDKDLERYEMVAPLLNGALDQFERRRLHAQIMEKYQISRSTLYFYVKCVKESGIKGLIAKERIGKGESKAIPLDIIEKAIEIRKELPSRSTRRILEILEMEKLVKPGEIALTTLNRQLTNRGFSSAAMKQKDSLLNVQPSLRFQRELKNALWQMDTKDGPTLVNRKTGKKTKTYVVVIIDDATRLVIASKFYDNERQEILEDCFRTGVLTHGKPAAVLVDNGTIYVSKWFVRACGSLGISHIRCKPRSPKSKGKVEVFNRHINEFVDELRLQPVSDIDELNRVYRIWLEEGYTRKPHSALTYEDADGKKVTLTPLEAYARNTGKVTYVSTTELQQAFLWEETRKVDNSGCFSFKGEKYEAGVDLIKEMVDVRYDPLDVRIVEVWFKGEFKRKSEVLDMPEFLPKKPKMPKITKETPSHSRLLGGYEETNSQRVKKQHVDVAKKPSTAVATEKPAPLGPAVSFASLEEQNDD
jgi:transposase InsO family protein